MKRDMDLIRELLLDLERRPVTPTQNEFVSSSNVKLSDKNWTADQIHYNLKLLIDGKFVDGRLSPDGQGILFFQLTWAGHDFLDSIRDPEIWRKTKVGAKQAGGFSFDLLKALATGFLKKTIEEKTGVELSI
jgi:hypothetical protein